MKIRLLLLTIVVGITVSCTTTVEDVQKLLMNRDFEQLHSYLVSEIETGNAKLSWPGEQPTAFELGLYNTLLYGQEHHTGLIKLVSKNLESIEHSEFIDNELWNHIINDHSIPSGLHNFLLTNYLEDPIMYKPFEQSIQEIIKSDSLFKPLLKTRFTRHVILHINEFEYIYKLAELGKLEEPLEILDSIKELKSNEFELESDQSSIRQGSGLFEYERQLLEVQSNIDKLMTSENPRIKNLGKPYIFRGYMIAFMREIRIENISYEVYEVRSYGGTTSMLATKVTGFKTKGTFSLRVAKDSEIPMTLNQAFGGFKQNIPLLVEVTDKEWEDYQKFRNDYNTLDAERTRLTNLIGKAQKISDSKVKNLEPKKDQINAEIKVLQDQLKSWVKQNI